MEHTDTARLNWRIAHENQEESQRILATIPPEEVQAALDKAMEEVA